MLEKFKSEKMKTSMFVVGIFVTFVIMYFIANSLFMGSLEEDAKKEEKKVTDVHIDYKDEQKNEQDSFKSIYGDKLNILEQNNEKLSQNLIELQKKFDDQKNFISENKNSNNMPELTFPKTTNSGDQQNAQTTQNFNIPVVEQKVEPIKKVVAKSTLLTISAVQKQDNNVSSKQETKIDTKKKLPVIPAGSFSRGVLMNGLDAPTSGAAQSSPHPVAIRVMDKSILPNKFRADIKDCVAIGLAYGELSSDRAIIKVSTLSCMKKDGTPLVSKGDNIGYVTGEDGKIGLEGRVVSKQGAILARVLVAGFMEGMGKVFQQSSTYVTTATTGTTSTPDPSKAMQTSLYGGAAEASKKISDYYLKLNDQMFPVVEIANGRKCDIMFTKPVIFEETKDE